MSDLFPRLDAHITQMLPELIKEYALPSWGKLSPAEIQQKPDSSYVTDVDLQLQDVLEHNLQQLLPGCSLLGEETRPGHQTSGWISCEWTWVIDSLDGTQNFVQGSPDFGSIIGLLHNGKPYAGWIYLPFGQNGRSLMLAGVQGHMPTANGTPLAPSKPQSDKPRVILSHMLQRRAAGHEITSFNPVPSVHCAAAHFAFVLNGQSEGFAHLLATPWDGMVAAAPMLEQLGGKIELADGRAPEGDALLERNKSFLALRRAEDWNQVAPAVFALAA